MAVVVSGSDGAGHALEARRAAVTGARERGRRRKEERSEVMSERLRRVADLDSLESHDRSLHGPRQHSFHSQAYLGTTAIEERVRRGQRAQCPTLELRNHLQSELVACVGPGQVSFHLVAKK